MPIYEDWLLDYPNRAIVHGTVRISYTGTGGFTLGETVTWNAGSDSAVVVYEDTTDDVLVIARETSTPAATDTITNGSQTCTVSSTTTVTTVYPVQTLYSWIMDQIDDSGTIDDTVPMTAQTPTSFTLTNSWFIDETSIQYLNGGSIKTEQWHAATYNDGIRIVTFTGSYTDAVVTDIGKGVTQATSGHTGTLLAYNNALQKWWIRVDDIGDDFNTTNAISVDSGTGSGVISTGSNLTGNNVWANPFTIGTLISDTRIYLYQNNSAITSWWSDGHIDIILLVKEAGSLIDDGIVSVYCRQYGSLYDHFITDLSAGTRTPIPLAIFNDTNNNTGYKSITTTAVGTDDFSLGDEITGDSSGARAIITAISGSNPTYTFTYYLIGDLTDFQNAAEGITNVDTTPNGTATKDANPPANAGPNTGTPATITVTFGNATADIDNDSTNEPYSVTIDCQQVALSSVYQRLKYLTRHGATGDIDNGSQSVIGEQYEAIGDYYLPYDTLSGGTFTQGATLTSSSQPTFSGTITSDYDRGSSDGFLIVRNVSGTVPADGENLTDGTASATVDEDAGIDPVATITPVKQAPFGTFAGGKFFGARGVLLTDIPATDANNYELIDSEGNPRTPPQSIPLTISNTEAGDRVSVFLSTGPASLTVNKTQFTSHASANTVGLNTFDVTTAIPADTPSTGSLRVPIRDDTTGKITGETRYTYTGWSGTQFTGVSPGLVSTYDDNDTAYVPYIDETAAGASVSKSLTYAEDRNVVIRVRNTGMKPFQVDGIIDVSGLSTTVIRETDSIYQ